MKSILLVGSGLLIVTMLSFTIYSHQTLIADPLFLANLEALATDESSSQSGSVNHVNQTVVQETYVTNSAGWTWDANLKVWKFGGQVTYTWPSEYTKTTTTTQNEYDCCIIGGTNPCGYAPCPKPASMIIYM